MKLHVIKRGSKNQLIIEEVQVLKETDNQLKISGNDIYRSTLNKSALDCYLDGYIFTYDINKGIEVWNNYYQRKIDNTKSMLKGFEACLISEEEIPDITSL